MVESQGKLMESRLGELFKSEKRVVVAQILNNLLMDEVKWTFFEDLLSSKRSNSQI